MHCIFWINLRGKNGFKGDLNWGDIHGFVTGFQADVGTGGRGKGNPNGNLAWGFSTVVTEGQEVLVPMLSLSQSSSNGERKKEKP